MGSLFGELGRRWLPLLGSGRAPEGEARELLLEAARAYERLFAVNYFKADMGGVTLAGLTNMALAERAGGATGERALGYATFGAMCSLSRMDGVARAYCARAMDIAQSSRDEVAETWVLMNVAVVHLQAARWTETDQCLERVRAMATRIGFNRRWEEATTQSSTARFLAGRFAESERLNTELLHAVERADPQSRCWAIVRQAELGLLRGTIPAALAAALEGERLCREGGLQRDEWVYTLGPLALAKLHAGDWAGARETAERCAAWIARGSAPIFYNVFAYAAVIEVYLALSERAGESERVPLLRAALRSLGRLRSMSGAMPIASPRAELWTGLVALHRGKSRARIRTSFEQSAARAKALDMPFDRALALAALGEHAADDRDHARRSLESARALFESCGATANAERTQGLLERL
jgi:hypothetical protein